MMSDSSCRFAGPRLRAFLDGELTEQETDGVRDHLVECAACREALAVGAQVAHLVSVLPAEIEPPPHFSADLQVRLASVRQRQSMVGRLWGGQRPRWSRRYSLAGATLAGTVVALVVGSPPGISAQELVGKVQESWSRLESYSCRFVAEGVVAPGRPRRFEQQQWFQKPGLFRLETNEHYPERTYVQSERVITYIPGANWRGQRVAIIRPRQPREQGLPFPFGADWPVSYDVTIEALIRELKAQQGGQLLGTERVLDKLCYVLKFHTRRPGASRPIHYMVWVDRESFLPLKVKTYRDNNYHTVSLATDLQTNVAVPAETFRYSPRSDTFHVYGDVEPFVFAMPFVPQRTPAFDRDPRGAAYAEIRSRGAKLPFQLYAPTYLPDSFVLVRVRHAPRSGWLDAYWLNNETGMVIKLLEQQTATEPRLSTADGEPIRLAGASARRAWWRETRRPFRLQHLAWNQGQTRLRLSAAGLDRDAALRIAASMTLVEPLESIEETDAPDEPEPPALDAEPTGMDSPVTATADE